ncbi:MAG: class III extradiol dioxygenase subunit B-like domain-containing protein [Actinomycetota bacterium]
MFAAGAVCPHPPLLVPEIAAGAAAELDGLRAACLEAVSRILDEDPARVVLVGDAPRQTTFGLGAVADFSAYGADLQLTLGQAGRYDGPRLPLSLSIGAWLLKEAGFAADVTAVGLPASVSADDASALARALVGAGEPVSFLAMGDGSARRSVAAPGYVDQRSADFDESVSKALAACDTDAILGLDPALAQALLCAGRASWQVLAGAASGHTLHGSVLYDDAPYGVGYFVATWTG